MASSDDLQTWAKRGAARKLALYAYYKPLIGIVIVVAGLFFFGGAEARGHATFLDGLGALFLGGMAAWLVKDIILWRLLVKKFNESELRSAWLEYGGFGKETE